MTLPLEAAWRRADAVLLALTLIACGGNDHDAADAAVLDAAVVDAAVADAAVADATGADAAPTPDAAVDAGAPTGRWTTGDLHVHTAQSNDAPLPLAAVLEAAFGKHQLDWITLANHLRVSDRDHQGNPVAGGSIPLSKGLALFEHPAIVALQQAGTYADRVIFSSVEWDMPTHDHFIVGILAAGSGSAPALQALAQFEYLFTNRDASLFDAADVARWGAQRWFSTHADALQAIAWLKEHHPETSYGIVAHPSRNPGRVDVADFRELNDLAPGIVFALEGMLGNQMEPDRGGYASPYIEANLLSRSYGGCDAVIARLGGTWDALLGEGRRVWNVGNSDFHFKTAQGQFSSGYAPGEYTRNHVWVDGEGMPAVLRGLRSGKVFSVMGDLISALDFTVAAPSAGRAEMGGELDVPAGSTITVTIRFKSERPSNFETPVGSGNVPGAIPVVDHVDLIVGDVGAKALPGTPAYDVAKNPSTRVLARFDATDWVTDAEGFHVVTHTLVADGDLYFRLRGTNLGADVTGETAAGEPLADARTELPDHQARFDAINARNYADLWFYSNPIFVDVAEMDDLQPAGAIE